MALCAEPRRLSTHSQQPCEWWKEEGQGQGLVTFKLCDGSTVPGGFCLPAPSIRHLRGSLLPQSLPSPLPCDLRTQQHHTASN